MFRSVRHRRNAPGVDDLGAEGNCVRRLSAGHPLARLLGIGPQVPADDVHGGHRNATGQRQGPDDRVEIRVPAMTEQFRLSYSAQPLPVHRDRETAKAPVLVYPSRVHHVHAVRN